MKGFIYILQSNVNQRFYIGSTINIEKRLEEHNQGKSTYTKFTRPFRLVFKQEFNTIREARKLEYKIKLMKNKNILNKIITDGKIIMKVN